MDNFEKLYYEQSEFWSRDFQENPAERERIEEITRIIPSDVHNILDVGCGNGAFINNLPHKYKATGLDFSKEALKYVKKDKILGEITNLPFEKESFDLVTCLEVLEHLSSDNFREGVLELQRISKKYIIITVPNKEASEYHLVMCPVCHCWFHPNLHKRSFNEKILQYLFDNFKLVKSKKIGPVKEMFYWNWLLFTFYSRWKRSILPKYSICPQCGYQSKEKDYSRIRKRKEITQNSFQRKVFSSLKSLGRRIWPAKKEERWLLALYKKSNG